jgi:hypothetical protein
MSDYGIVVHPTVLLQEVMMAQTMIPSSHAQLNAPTTNHPYSQISNPHQSQL